MATPVAEPEAVGIDCTPGACAGMCGACLMFLMSMLTVASLGVIAGGAFWMAQVTYQITDGGKVVQMVGCLSDDQMKTGFSMSGGPLIPSDTSDASNIAMMTQYQRFQTYAESVDSTVNTDIDKFMQSVYQCHCSAWESGTAQPHHCVMNYLNDQSTAS